MIRVALHLNDPTQRLMLRAVLERADCSISDDVPDVIIDDNFEEAVRWCEVAPSLVVTGLSDVTAALQAMQRGVWGYILLPLHRGEAEIMVRRAAAAGRPAAPFEPRPLAEVELEHILAVLRHCNGNRSNAARMLGIGRNTLWRKLAALEREAETTSERIDDIDERT